MKGKVGAKLGLALTRLAEKMSEEERQLGELRILNGAIPELVRHEVFPGDGDLPTKARRVLELGAKHISEGRPAPVFLQYVASSINAYLNGEETSLDSAFRLKNKKHRPKADAFEDDAIVAYIDAMEDYRLAVADDAKKLPAEAERFAHFLANMHQYSHDEQNARLDEHLAALGPRLTDPEESFKRATRAAIDAAYAARWGDFPQVHAERHIAPEVIKSRKRSIKDSLRELGFFDKEEE
jgi:hypothetical protein